MRLDTIAARSALVGTACAFLLLMSACDHDHHTWTPSWDDLPDPGAEVQETRALGNVGGVILDGVGHVRILQGKSPSLVIRTGENFLPLIRTEQRGDDLLIGWIDGTSFQGNASSLEFFVTVERLERIELSGAGWIRADQIDTEQLTVNRSGVGDIDIRGLSAGRLDVTQSGIGDVGVQGTVQRQVVTLDEMGDYEAGNLASTTAEVTVESGGSATVRVSERLVARIYSSGSIYYHGDPIVERTGSGAGSVLRID